MDINNTYDAQSSSSPMEIETHAFQRMDTGRDDATEDLIALANEKREQITAAKDDSMVQSMEQFLNNPNLDNLAAGQVLVQQIRDPELRDKMEKQLAILEQQQLKERDARLASTAGALLGPLCKGEVRGKPCTRIANPKYGVMCEQCHHNLMRLPRNIDPADRFKVKQEKKRSRERIALEKKAALIAQLQAEQREFALKQKSERKKARPARKLSLHAAAAAAPGTSSISLPGGNTSNALGAVPSTDPMLMLPAPPAAVPFPAPVHAAINNHVSTTTPSVVQLGNCGHCHQDVSDGTLDPCAICNVMVCDFCLDDHVRLAHNGVACAGCSVFVVASNENRCNTCSASACPACQARHICPVATPAVDDGDEIPMDEGL